MSAPDMQALQAHGTTLAALKGLAIASSLLSAGQLGTISTLLPSLYPAALTSHRLAAQQFAAQYRTLKATGPPVELLTSIIFGGLAYLHWSEGRKGWTLWAASAAAMLSVIPYTIVLMEPASKKLLWVSEVHETASTTPGPQPTGIGIKVTAASASGSPMGNSLGLPSFGGKGSGRDGAITPMEEFEPFEDAVMDEKEYEQLKVIKLLKNYNSYNTMRVFAPLTAGVLGLWAALNE